MQTAETIELVMESGNFRAWTLDLAGRSREVRRLTSEVGGQLSSQRPQATTSQQYGSTVSTAPAALYALFAARVDCGCALGIAITSATLSVFD